MILEFMEKAATMTTNTLGWYAVKLICHMDLAELFLKTMSGLSMDIFKMEKDLYIIDKSTNGEDVRST